jgi:putative lipoprotein
MRRIILPLLLAAPLALAGCSSSSDNAQQAAAPAPTSVSGTITLRDTSISVSPNAKLDVNLVDVSRQGSSPIATKSFQPVTLPQQYKLDFDAAAVNANDIYVVQATMVDGDRTFDMPLQAPVLTKGKPATADIALQAKATAGEKELAGFKDLQKRIGGLKVTNGTQLQEGVSRGWQVFRNGADIVFIRELVDYGDKGFTSTDYAYKNGKVWVAEQQKKPSKDGKATATERASWNDAGDLVLKTNDAGGKTSPLSDDEAANLKKQAESILAKGKGGK